MREEYSKIKSWGRLPNWSSELIDEQFDIYTEAITELPYAESFEELEVIMGWLPHEADPLSGGVASFIHDIERSPLWFEFVSSRNIEDYDPGNEWLEVLNIRYKNWLEMQDKKEQTP